MQVPTGLCEERRDMAGRAARFAVEEILTPARRRGLKTARRWFGNLQRELVHVERRKLRGDPIFHIHLMSLARPGSYRILLRIIQTRVIKSAFAMHLQIGDISVP